LKRLLHEGVTTIEIKSGYGLDLANELKLLRVARRLGGANGVDVQTTLLAAHVVPPEYAGRAAEYVALVCEEIIPAAARDRLADAADAFCERIAFSPDQTRRVFNAARAAGLRVKLHADQLSDSGGAALAAEVGALSADHLEHANEAGIAAMASAHTVAVLLPGAFYCLRETRLPPVAALRANGVALAIATDCNPGTSPVTSLLLMLNMACTLFRLTPEEALAGVTRHAAQALGLNDRGRLAVGARADVALWDIGATVELAYAVGANPLAGVVRGGRVVRWA
jgi:imidazolonepropionase